MDTNINFWKEQLHEIVIKTENGRELRLFIDQNEYGFCLSGEFYEIDDKVWYLVGFSRSRVDEAEPLLKNCLVNLRSAMLKKGDTIKSIHNTCNDPIVSAEEQEAIISSLGLTISVTVN